MDKSIRSKETDFAAWQRLAAEADAAIRRENYYLALWEVIPGHDLKAADKASLLRPFQLFWEALPDSRSIRRPPFSLICALGEEYCFGDDATTPEQEIARENTMDSLRHRVRQENDKPR